MHNQTSTSKWSPSKQLYLILSILLSIKVLPAVGMMLNSEAAGSGTFNFMGFIFIIAGLSISVTILGRAHKDDMGKLGALLGLISYILAAVAFLLFYLAGRTTMASLYTSDLYDVYIVLGYFISFISWVVTIVATIFSYINTFKTKKIETPVMYGQMQANQQPIVNQPVQSMAEPVKVGYNAQSMQQNQAVTPITPQVSRIEETPATTQVTASHQEVKEPVATAIQPQAPKENEAQKSKNEAYVAQVTNFILDEGQVNVVETPIEVPQKTEAIKQVAEETKENEKILVVTADMLDMD